MTTGKITQLTNHGRNFSMTANPGDFTFVESTTTPVSPTKQCDHCYCETAPKSHKKCCKCPDVRHKKFVSVSGRAKEG
jgi:hypothetical protein